jgi:hypothetical protein
MSAPLKDPDAERARAILARADAELRQVRRAARALEAARLELHESMRDARAAGVPLRPIATAAGLSVEWTRRLTAPAA